MRSACNKPPRADSLKAQRRMSFVDALEFDNVFIIDSILKLKLFANIWSWVIKNYDNKMERI
jgi:hypothetical protein